MYLNEQTRKDLKSIYRGRYPDCPSGYLDRQRLLRALSEMDKTELLAYLEATLIAMDPLQVEDVFGELARDRFVRALSPEAVLEAIRQFQQDSVAGKYYAPFDMDSKNYNDVPLQTEAWFNEMSAWLNRVCDLAESGEIQSAKEGFRLLFKLLDNMTNEIVFAHELGDWMIPTRRDYRAVYERLIKGAD